MSYNCPFCMQGCLNCLNLLIFVIGKYSAPTVVVMLHIILCVQGQLDSVLRYVYKSIIFLISLALIFCLKGFISLQGHNTPICL